MASMSPICITKQPLKFVEIPLNKFSEEVVPHHQRIFEQYKSHIYKLISVNNSEQLSREIKDKKRVVKQLKDLMYELDTLRTQIEDRDLDKFDNKTLSLRKIILNLITGYSNLEKSANKVIQPVNYDQPVENKEETKNADPFYGVEKIQIQANMDDLKLQEQQDTLNRVEDINKDVEDLHQMYRNLNEMVHVQGDLVENIEENVEAAQENVRRGIKSIVSAHKLKAVAYPVSGAVLGGLIGGPLGLLAGAKIGGLAALTCAAVGYTGGKLFNKVADPDKIAMEQTDSLHVEDEEGQEKKDI